MHEKCGPHDVDVDRRIHDAAQAKEGGPNLILGPAQPPHDQGRRAGSRWSVGRASCVATHPVDDAGDGRLEVRQRFSVGARLQKQVGPCAC